MVRHFYHLYQKAVGMTFVSAGKDMFSWDLYIETMKGMQKFNDFSLMENVTTANKEAAIKIRKKLELVGLEGFDIIVCDYSVLYAGLYYSVLGKKVIVFSSFLPPLPAVEPSWPYPLTAFGGQSENMGFLGRMYSAIGTWLFPYIAASMFKSALEDKEFASNFKYCQCSQISWSFHSSHCYFCYWNRVTYSIDSPQALCRSRIEAITSPS